MLTQEVAPAQSAGSLLSQLSEISGKVSKIEKALGTEDVPVEKFLFTSESVNEGHPDKLADQVSDSIVDACFRGDPESHVACETSTGAGTAGKKAKRGKIKKGDKARISLTRHNSTSAMMSNPLHQGTSA